MTQKEIIEFEETNTGVIRLYLEGSFYKAYERSAFAFCTRIKDYKVLRKESKTLGRDILYVGFPMTALDRTLGNAMTKKVDEVIIDVMLSYPINENEFFQWRDAQEVEQASRSLLSPYTKVIEKSPVYKTAYDILTQVILISGNISKNCQTPFGLRMKELSFRGCYLVRGLYDLKGEQRSRSINEKSGDMLAVAKFASSDEQPAPENQNPGGQPEGGNQGGGEGGDENPGEGIGF